MNTTQITETLLKLYTEDGHRIVFWNDPEGEFLESLPDILPEGIELLRPDETGSLSAKIRIELEKPKQRFLVYSPKALPEPEDDWLLDIRLYSRIFSADSASLLLNDLGLTNQSLRGYLASRKAFLSSKDRGGRLKKWVFSDDTSKELDRKMLAVTVRAAQPETFAILLKVFGDFTDELEQETEKLPGMSGFPDFVPAAWHEVEKFGLSGCFWSLAEESFGYSSATPSLSDLLVHLFVSDLANSAGDLLPKKVRSLCLTRRSGSQNASVFLANWRGSVDHLERYRKISNTIEVEIGCDQWIGEIEADALSENETFETIERRLIVDLRDRILSGLPPDGSEIRLRINARQGRFWSRGSDGTYSNIYKALAAALEFFVTRDRHKAGFNFANAKSLLTEYTAELFKFDQSYRLFREFADPVLRTGRNILDPLVENLEKAYGNWYIERLAINWGDCVEHEDLLTKWQVEGFKNQYRFYDDVVQPSAYGTTERKVYVIVSDAFRYECAEELTRELNTEARKSGNAIHEAKITAVLGVLPSYTGLGMASLLPHETLTYKVNSSGLEPQADGRSTLGIANRNTILNQFDGAAIKYDDLTRMNRDAGREFVRKHRVVYVYHNRVDATGDNASTEEGTFDAVRKSINELKDLVTSLFHMSGSQIFITADHGFLFQQSSPESSDKSELQVASGRAKVRKKRYVIDADILPQDNAWHGHIRNTAKIDGDMQFLVPKGANRFHFSGGSRFVHGGAMPQEIVIPVVSVKKLQGKAAERSAVKKAGVALLGNLTRIVNNVQRLQFIQTDVVSDRVTPRTIQISLRDQNDDLISNEETVTFDSKSNSMEERTKEVQLILRTGQYERTRTYYILLNDADAIVKEYLRIPVTIDIAFSSDF